MILALNKVLHEETVSEVPGGRVNDIPVKQKPLCAFCYFLDSRPKSDIFLATTILFRYGQNIRQDVFLKCYTILYSRSRLVLSGVSPESGEVGDFSFSWLVIFFGLVLLLKLN